MLVRSFKGKSMIFLVESLWCEINRVSDLTKYILLPVCQLGYRQRYNATVNV